MHVKHWKIRVAELSADDSWKQQSREKRALVGKKFYSQFYCDKLRRYATSDSIKMFFMHIPGHFCSAVCIWRASST